MKFRISLSLEQLDYILSCSDCPADLRKQLELAKFKASNGYVKPSYEIKERALTPKTAKQLPLELRYRLACQAMEVGKELNEEQKAAVAEFRYLNDLMSPEEMEAYESEQLGL